MKGTEEPLADWSRWPREKGRASREFHRTAGGGMLEWGVKPRIPPCLCDTEVSRSLLRV